MRMPVRPVRFRMPRVSRLKISKKHLTPAKPTPEKQFKRAYKRGRMAIKYRNTQCMNCEQPLAISHRYCPYCSQLNSNKKTNLIDFFEELFATLFSYDSKLRRTFMTMLFRPGKITREYIAGKRMKYANPFRFFLSLSIVYFFLLNCSGNFKELDRFGAGYEKDPFNITNSDIINWTFTSGEDRKTIDENMKLFGKEGISPVNIDSIQREQERKDSIRLLEPLPYFKSLEKKGRLSRFSSKVYFFQAGIRKQKVITYSDVTDSLEIDNTYENKLAFKSAGSLVKATNQPGSYLSFMVSKLPFIIFFFLPVFALFIWMVYPKKKFGYTDHLIFSFHTQTMLIVLLIISFITELIFAINTVAVWALSLFLLYLYKAMRNFYRQGRLKTIVKFMFLNSIFFILATVTVLFFFIVSVFTY